MTKGREYRIEQRDECSLEVSLKTFYREAHVRNRSYSTKFCNRITSEKEISSYNASSASSTAREALEGSFSSPGHKIT